MSDETENEPVWRLAPWRWALRLLALAGIALSVYLLTVSLLKWGLPAGCGSGSGCEAVLSSRWSNVFGVPVSGLALVVYAGILAASFGISADAPPARQRLAWFVLSALGCVAAASAVWFIGLQLVVLRAVCPWCMAGHVVGLFSAAIVYHMASRSVRTAAEGADRGHRPVSRAASAAVGVSLVVVLAAGQCLVAVHPSQIQRLVPGQNSDTGPGPARAVSILDGSIPIEAHEVPCLGSADAPKLLILLFDYCCPHCRATHGYLLHALERYPDQIGILALPMPLNRDCNPNVDETEHRFRHACELARLALAVWRADRTAFPEFDRYLFEPETPRTPDEARKRAADLVSAAALERALADPWIDERIAQDVGAYAASQAERIPVILSPGFASIVGRPESEAELLEILERELGLQPPDPGRKP